MAAEVQSRAAIDAQLLARFEAQVELPAWFMARGFHIAPLQPDPSQLALTGPGLEVLHLRRDLDRGTWSYTNSANPTDRGTVVDFMCKHEGATLATCVNRLAGCVVRSHLSPEGIAYQEAMRDRSNTLHAAVAVHLAALEAEREATRGLEGLGVDRAAFDETRFGRLRDGRDVEALLREPHEARTQSLPPDGSPGGARRTAARRDRLRAEARQGARLLHLHGRQPRSPDQASDRSSAGGDSRGHEGRPGGRPRSPGQTTSRKTWPAWRLLSN